MLLLTDKLQLKAMISDICSDLNPLILHFHTINSAALSYFDNAVYIFLLSQANKLAKKEKMSYNNKVRNFRRVSDIKKVEIFTDGACSGNPGPGGYGVILRFGEHVKELSGGEHETTNNRMELTGVIKGLAALKEPCEVTLTTDSKYVVDSVTKGWVYGWQKNGWVKSDKKPALNVDLWKELLPLLEKHKVTFVWVKGHAGHPENERCDQLAVIQRDINS